MVLGKKKDFRKWAILAARVLDEKKAEDIFVLSIRPLTPLTDFLILATANSGVHLEALSEAIAQFFKAQGVLPIHYDGVRSASWRALDYGGFWVHVMTEEARQLYQLERIWSEARKVDLRKRVNANSKVVRSKSKQK